jgi:hypothetical protein
LEQDVNLHITVIVKTYETDYEVPCTSGISGRRNIESLDVGWCVCVVSLAALRVRFQICSGGLVVSLHDTHEAETLGRN